MLLKIGGVEDHVHLLVRFKPTMALSDATRRINAYSSKWLNQRTVTERFRWQAGYGAFTVAKSTEPLVSRYIEDQAQHHQKRTFEEEFVQLLKLNEMDYDEERLWD